MSVSDLTRIYYSENENYRDKHAKWGEICAKNRENWRDAQKN